MKLRSHELTKTTINHQLKNGADYDTQITGRNTTHFFRKRTIHVTYNLCHIHHFAYAKKKKGRNSIEKDKPRTIGVDFQNGHEKLTHLEVVIVGILIPMC